MSDNYLKNVKEYWSSGYPSENIESHIFRFYGNVLRDHFGVSGSGHEKLLDFGCGQGAAINFFSSKGFNAFGVDASKSNIDHCKNRYPDLAENFHLVPHEPEITDCWFGGNFKIITAIQVLYYYNPEDISRRLHNLYEQMDSGGILYVSMMGTKCWFYDHAKRLDDGMYRVDLSCSRFTLSDYRITFVHSEEELISLCKPFTPVHIGEYSAKYLSDEGLSFHYTFIGRK